MLLEVLNVPRDAQLGGAVELAVREDDVARGPAMLAFDVDDLEVYVGIVVSHDQERGLAVFPLFCQGFDCRGHFRRSIGGRRVGTRKDQASVIIENVRAVQMHDPVDFRVDLIKNAVREGFR